MPHLAHILIGDSDRETAAKHAEALRVLGYRCQQESDRDAILSLAAAQSPDVVLLGQFDNSIALAKTLKTSAETRHIPVVLTDQAITPTLMAAARAAEVDDVLPLDDPDLDLRNRLTRLVRSSVMLGELDRRVASAAEFGLAVNPGDFQRGYPEKPHVIAVSQDGEALTRLRLKLEPADLHCVPEISSFRACDRLDEGRFDAAVIDVGPKDDLSHFQLVCEHIRNNPRLFNLPTLVLTEDGGDVSDTDLYREGAAVVLPISAGYDVLAHYIHMLVARQRLRWTLRDPFRATLADQTADSLGVVYSKAFWDAHLARSVAAAQKRGANLSVAYLTTETLLQIKAEFGEENSEILAHQLADWTAGMTRIEDTVARITENSFAVLLPETEKDEASFVINRLVGILHSSEFRLGEEIMQSVNAWIDAGIAGLKPEDSAESLMARAIDRAS